MTDILIEQFIEKHKDLRNQVEICFKQGNLTDTFLNEFYTEVSKLLAKYDYEHLLNSEDFYKFKKFVNSQIYASIEDSDHHLLNQSLEAISYEIIQIIENNIY